MDDFSTPGKVNDYNLPPSPSNFIKPKKMPLSSMVPTVIVDKHGNPRLLIGAAGGTKITTSVAQVRACNIYLNIRSKKGNRKKNVNLLMSSVSV